MSGRGDLLPDAFEICAGVHIRPGALERLLDIDPQTMFERTQLLELLALLEHPVWQLREMQERGDAISIDTAMTARTGEIALAHEPGRRAVAVPRNGCAAEIERHALGIRHHLDDVGIEQL